MDRNKQSQQSASEFKLYPWRFVVVTAIFFVIFANVMQFAAYGSVTPTVAKHYEVGNFTINSLNIWNMAAFFPAVYPSTWLLDTHGLRPAIISAGFINAFGSMLRWLSFAANSPDMKVNMLYAGSAIIGVASPLSADAVTKAAARWFSGEGRLTANAVMGLATPLGGAAGLLMGPMIVSGDPNNVDTFNCVLFACSVGFGLMSFAVFNDPPSPPSESAKQGTVGFKEGLGLIVRNSGFWILVVVFTGVFSTFQLMTTFISNYVTPYGFSEEDAGNFGVALVLSGIVAAVLVGLLCDKTKSHQVAVKVLSVILAVGTICFYFGVTNSTGWLVYFGAGLIGVGGLPVMSLCMELGAECTWPVAEGTSTGILMTISQMFTIIVIFVTNSLTEPVTGKLWKALFIGITLAGISVVGSIFYQTENKRILLEREVTEGQGLAIL
ncbi:Major facilitator super domain-containing protein 7 [Rhizoclosmatium hyalinum]|nr:Major facilitator super domain-containing protein 7 [Rhizoclosmatium hyalinum]